MLTQSEGGLQARLLAESELVESRRGEDSIEKRLHHLRLAPSSQVRGSIFRLPGGRVWFLRGDRVASYEIRDPLASGGEVYRAKDTRLDRSVAIKVLGETPRSPASGTNAGAAASPVLVLNWTEELKRLVASTTTRGTP